MQYIFFIIANVLISLFIKYDGPNYVYEISKIKYNKWLRLNKLVSSKYKSPLMIKWISILMLFEAQYLKFIQYMNNSVKKIDKNIYELSYVINGKLYKMLMKPSKGPAPILRIINECNIDVTEIIIPYLGPNHDWHNKEYHPHFFNCEILIFELSEDDKKKFHEKEIIKF